MGRRSGNWERRSRTAVVALLLACVAAAAPALAADAGRFVPAGQTAMARAGAASVQLTDGRVLIAGGFFAGSPDPSRRAEIYNPATGGFSLLQATLGSSRIGAAGARLPDGRVLIIGGGSKSAEVFDPVTNAFAPLANQMSAERQHAIAAPLPGGRVLIAGGATSAGSELASAEIFNAADGTFAPLDEPLSTTRDGAAAAPLPDGRVLIAGGRLNTSTVHASAEVFTPSTGKFTAVGSMGTARWRPLAAPLPDGRVLVAGGMDDDSDPLASAEVFDPATGSFAPLTGIAGEMTTTRWGGSAAALADGRVLISGGFEFDKATASAELFEQAPQPLLTGAGEFGEQAVGSASAERVFTLGNQSASTLDVGHVGITGAASDDYELVSDGCSGAHITPGLTCAIAARFAPTDLGARPAELVVSDNAPSRLQRVALTGTGVPATAATGGAQPAPR